MKNFGIDISKWQGDFNFNAALSEGVSFAIIKGGGGDDGLYKDGKFERNYSEAKKLGVPIGVYWFSKALSVAEAEAEAEFFYENVLESKQFELPVFIDVEHKEMLNKGKRLLTDIIKKWCFTLEQKNYWVGVYASLYTFNSYTIDSELKQYTHWVAQWADECTYPNKDIMGFWQFGGETNLLRTNKVAGVVCDQNYMYFDFPTLIKEIGLNGFQKPVSKPSEKKTTEELAKEVIAGRWGVGAARKRRLTEEGYDYNAVQSLVDKLMAETKKNQSTVKAGDLAKMKRDGVIYQTQSRFADFVYTSLLYVRQLEGDRAVISILPEGPVTGAVDVKYLTKYII